MTTTSGALCEVGDVCFFLGNLIRVIVCMLNFLLCVCVGGGVQLNFYLKSDQP